jgi:hypothetical protein
MRRRWTYIILLILLVPLVPSAQKQQRIKERSIHYRPDGTDFVCMDGKQRFNRALYGSNTAFRVEAGDLPEFALYLPGMGGNLQFGLMVGDSSKWLIQAKNIEARYRPGSMLYKVSDPLLRGGILELTALPLFEGEGLIVKMEGKNLPTGIGLVTVFGGATGQRFSRDGDIGADPESSFYLKPEYCRNNIIDIQSDSSFRLFFGARNPVSAEEQRALLQKGSIAGRTDIRQLNGIFPRGVLQQGDAAHLQTPYSVSSSSPGSAPLLRALHLLTAKPLYFFISAGGTSTPIHYDDLHLLFNRSEAERKKRAAQVTVSTPDPYINTLGGALSMAADAIWEAPSYMHGAVAWRMRLPGWRGAYAADVMGWHDRARTHFDAYLKSQVTTPPGPVVMDTALNLARSQEKMGTSMFSGGYIARNPNGDFRPHHYDMNLVFMDQLLNHILWTGDTAYLRKVFPAIKLHLEWEKRNFDTDGDGLYDAYAAIWASDALQYSGGGVTHSSAYNYRSNDLAAKLASIIGEEGSEYRREADKILSALNKQLWMPSIGVYAEYRDLLGNKLLHPSPGLWTIYHAIDSRVHDLFQGWQALEYIDRNIPHIPIKAKNFPDTTLYTLSTTSWQPYTWSLNNVALGELMHTALAYWQGGRSEEAFRLWRSTLIESMYLGASPGNLQQLSYYDAVRGELYRDFADGIGMTARSLAEGLFGMQPDGLKDTLFIQPGLPSAWPYAHLTTPDLSFSFNRDGARDTYKIKPSFPQSMKLCFRIPARMDEVEVVLVNGVKSDWSSQPVIGPPLVQVVSGEAKEYTIEILWKGKNFTRPALKERYASGEIINIGFSQGEVNGLYDPQEVFARAGQEEKSITATVSKNTGDKTFFIRTAQGSFDYWMPLSLNVTNPVDIMYSTKDGRQLFYVVNHSSKAIKGKLWINEKTEAEYNLLPGASSPVISKAWGALLTGTNKIIFTWHGGSVIKKTVNWDAWNPKTGYKTVKLDPYFNDHVTNIFKNKYRSPRPQASTLQLPLQGIGNWAYPLVTANINDSGLRKRAGVKGEFRISNGVPFATPSAQEKKNIIFTSQWDNYPDSVNIPLEGRARHAYFLMAGTTNAMQSRLVNGSITVRYKDGTSEVLELKNPENWWPIEQDYMEDGYAFTTGAPKPVRVYLKTGIDTRNFSDYTSIKGYSNRAVDGGAATVLDLPLHPSKELHSLTLRTIANDVVIGLMSVTLVR